MYCRLFTIFCLVSQVYCDSLVECQLVEAIKKYGCILRNVNLTSHQPTEITMKHTLKNENDITFIMIIDSHVTKLPNTDKFIHLDKFSLRLCSGLAKLDNIRFNYSLKFITIIESDVEIIDETVFKNNNAITVLTLSSNNIKIVHKNSFKDLINVEKIFLNSNLLEYLDDNTFAYNFKLTYVELNDNKLIRLSTLLFSRNIKIQTLYLQNNLINQIEQGFYLNMMQIKFLNLMNNKCVYDKMLFFNFAALNNVNQQKEFKLCYLNFEMMKETKIEIKSLEVQLNNMSEQIQNLAERATNDLKILENKLSNNTELKNISTNLLNFWKKSIDEQESRFKKDLENISSDIRTDMENTIEQHLESKINKHDELDNSLYNLTYINSAKLNMVNNNMDSVTYNTKTTFKHIYFLYFIVILLSIAFSGCCYMLVKMLKINSLTQKHSESNINLF